MPGTTYSPAVGLVYVFNLIVGTGALAIPKAFGLAGWLVSSIVVILLAIFSYATATFVIESMACANAVKHWQLKKNQITAIKEEDARLMDADDTSNYQLRGNSYHAGRSTDQELDDTEPLLAVESRSANRKTVFEIVEVVELGEMASLFFNKAGITLFYICMVVYLFGDLAIYAAAVPKSLRDVVCVNVSHYHLNESTASDLCWPTTSLTRSDVYRIFVAAFTLCLGPFVFFSLQKTIYLQIFTTVLRWTAFMMMIVLSAIQLSKVGARGDPPIADLRGMTNLFGVCVYAFMCHHSLPQMTTPIRDKSSIYRLIAADYTLIMVFYLVLCFTAVYSFASVDDLYTLNFGPGVAPGAAVTDVAFVQYFLALFPVFTLSSSFPIIAITLRNNLKTLSMLFRRDGVEYPWAVDRLVFPVATLAVPIAIAFATDDIQFLVGFTGSYAGAAIQYILPASFVLLARRVVKATIPDGDDVMNPYESPFRHTIWCVVIFAWSVLCVGFVTANHVVAALGGTGAPGNSSTTR